MMTNKEEQTTSWHALQPEEALQSVDSANDGLTSEEARSRLERHGENTLERDEGVNPVALIFKQLRSPLIYLLAAAAVVSLLVGHYLDAGFILGVVIINSILGIVQEWRAERALEALHKISAPKAKVVRDGGEQEIRSAEVVPGDILLLKAGDRVAADARILKGENLKADESALTGESEPVLKSIDKVDETTMLAERTNMVWMSTVITSGNGRAVVVATGMDTEMGRIAGQVQQAEREETPVQRRIGKMGTFIGIGGIALAAGVFGIGILKGYDLVTMLLFSVAVAVSAIPEGLPAVISITLALGVQRMAKRNAIIRRLPAVETLGSATVICSDKTGTITKNEMTVTRLWAGGIAYSVSGEGYEPQGEIRTNGSEGGGKHRSSHETITEDLNILLRVGCLTNDSTLLHEDDRGWIIKGDPTEGALLAAARKADLDPEELRKRYDLKDKISFSSDLQYMATLHRMPDQKGTVLFVKGAPERILDFCSHINENGEQSALDGTKKNAIEEVMRAFASQGLRVLAAAYRDMPGGQDQMDQSEAEHDLTFAGLWGIVDPPRTEAIEAIKAAKEAGIRVVMLTGDNAVTAAAIAEQAGITDGSEEAATGRQIEELSEEELADRVTKVDVFARVSPSHKIKIMEALKGQGQIVAMTGDGINDAPALKGADIGVAMGRKGSEVAREAADMILTDDNFATIVNAIEEGRVIFSNLRRVVFFLVATSAAEIVTLSGALLIGLPLPLTAIMILWINLVTDGPADVSLGIEPKHRNVLKQPPRAPDEGIFDWSMIRRVLLLALVVAAGTLGLFVYSLQRVPLAHAQTVAFTTLAAFQWFQAFNARSQYLSIFSLGVISNRWLVFGVGIAVMLQLGVIYSEIGHAVFETHPLTAMDWALILPVAGLVVVADELLKLLGVHGRHEKSHIISEGRINAPDKKA